MTMFANLNETSLQRKEEHDTTETQLGAALGDVITPSHPGALRLELPHESTHRRYEPPFVVGISQAAAGYLKLVAPPTGLHYVKLLCGVLTATDTATLVFNQGAGVSADPAIASMGALHLAANGGFVLPPAPPENPWLYTSPELVFGLTSTTSPVNGWLMVCFTPYDR